MPQPLPPSNPALVSALLALSSLPFFAKPGHAAASRGAHQPQGEP